MRRASSTDDSPRRRRGGGCGKGSDPGASPSFLSVSFDDPSGEKANDGREDGQSSSNTSSRQLFADVGAKTAGTGRQGEPSSGASGNEGTATEEEGFEGEDEVFAIKNLDTGEAIHISEVRHPSCPLREAGLELGWKTRDGDRASMACTCRVGLDCH